MAYQKTSWKKGDIITAEKLNKIEEGIAKATLKIGNGLQINQTDGSLEIGNSIEEVAHDMLDLQQRVNNIVKALKDNGITVEGEGD